MVKITDTIEIHDGVALMIGRHDSAIGPNLNAVGGMYAYAMGKFAPEYFRIDPPEYIVHSPVSRARNTAKMHRIAQGVTTGNFPDIAYDERLHEGAGLKNMHEAAKEAIREARFRRCKTIEIITHSDSPLSIASCLGGDGKGSLDYGGMVVLKADSWEDMIDPNVPKKTVMIGSSKELVTKVLGQTQIDILDYMIHPTAKIEETPFGKNEEIQEIAKKANVCFEWYGKDISYSEPQLVINAVIEAKREETREWAIKALKGEEVESVVRPDEFMEMFDAYKYWAENMALSISMSLPTYIDNPLHSELMEKLVPSTARTLVERLSENDESELHPIFNAYADKLEGKKFSSRKADIQAKSQSFGLVVPGYTDVMEAEKLAPKAKENMESETSHPDDDHPLLYALLAARMKKNGKL